MNIVLDHCSNRMDPSFQNIAKRGVKSVQILKPAKKNTYQSLETQAAQDLKEIGVDQLLKCQMPGFQDQWICPWENCGTLSVNLSCLKSHFFSVHNTRPYACDVENCVWAFPTKSKLERHKCAHMSEKSFVCDFYGCGKTFKSLFYLRHHRKHVHESMAKFVCSIAGCNAAFHNQKSLDFHLSDHIEAKPGYCCNVENCGKSFFTRNALCTHMKRHNYKDGDLRCKLCGKEFEVPCRLRTHMQGHEKEHPYPCTMAGCEWSFPSQSKLERHMDKHLQRRRFPCSFPGCSKAFLRPQHVSDHMKTHLKLKVFRCPVEMCDAVFDARRLVQPHVARVHQKVNKPKTSPALPSREARTPTKSSPCYPYISLQESVTSNCCSARTSLTYQDFVHNKEKREKAKVSKNDSNDQPPRNEDAGAHCVENTPRDDSPLEETSCAGDLETRDILQPDNPSTVQQDLMLSGACLSDPSNLIMQDELLTQEYFLLLESTRLSHFEPSTINLRDLE